MNIPVIYIQAKDCTEKVIELPGADVIIKKISSLLQFTASDGFKPSFDALSTAECNDLQCLFDIIDKWYKIEVGLWVKARLKMLMRFISNNKVIIPTCLAQYDELAKRLVIGLLYVLRDKIYAPIMIDDMMSFVTNMMYSDAFSAVMRPYWYTKNRNLTSEEILAHNPIVITPGGQGKIYRIADPYKYVVLFDHYRWKLPRKDIEQIANS
jgi:hypothetical protein